MLSKRENLEPLGFTPKDLELAQEDDEDMLEVLDAFISKIATMLLSLLEGEQDIEILQKMSFSLSVEDLKERLVNVFGNFLHKLKLYPLNLIQPGQRPESVPLNVLSKANKDNCLAAVSINRIRAKLQRDSFEGNIQEAFGLFILF